MAKQHWRRLVVVGIVFTFGAATPSAPALAYSATYDRNTAYDTAYRGLYERYVFGGGMWIDNDKWDSNEGIDCSGYVDHVWALQNQVADGTWSHDYSTGSYAGPANTYWHTKGSADLDFLTAIVGKEYNDLSKAGHIILVNWVDSDGTIHTMEAMDTAHGVVESTTTWAKFQQGHPYYTRWIARNGWGDSGVAPH